MQKFDSELLEKRRLTHDTQAFEFKVPEDFDFIPGQFVMLWSDKICDENDKPIKRAFSIASAPVKNGKIELCIKVSSEFGLSKRSQDADSGDIFHMHGPMGKFGPHETDFNNWVMVVAGSGITPCMSMIRNTDYKTLDGQHHLFYINKTGKDVIYDKEIKELVEASEGKLKVLHFITRDENAEADYHERCSLKHLTDVLGDFKNKSFFICGPIELVREINYALMDQGVPKELIHKEAWNT